MHINIVSKVIGNNNNRYIIVSKQTNDRSDAERKGIDYVYVWILSDKYNTAEY